MFYQSDFGIDKNITRRNAASDQAVDKALFWISRPPGMYCFRERDVFLKDARQYNIWKLYEEQTHDRILVYTMELTGTQSGTIWDNLYELDYPQYFRHAIETAQPVSVNRLLYEHDTRDIPENQRFSGGLDRILGSLLYCKVRPHGPAVSQKVLRTEWRNRGRAVLSDFKVHVTALHDSRIETEAWCIVDSLKDLSVPNNLNKTHFVVEISPRFAAIVFTKDNDRFFTMLPYKSLYFVGIKGRHGVYTVINRNGCRDVSIRRPRSSIHKQLSDSKQTASPKKTAAGTKKDELEV